MGHGRCRLRTRSCKVRIHPVTHDPLQTHTGAQKPDTDKRERIGPHWIHAAVCDAGLARHPYGEGSCHGEKRLDERAKRHPQTRFAA